MPSVLANCQECLSKHAELEILNPFSSVIIIVRLLIREPWTRYRWKPDLSSMSNPSCHRRLIKLNPRCVVRELSL